MPTAPALAPTRAAVAVHEEREDLARGRPPLVNVSACVALAVEGASAAKRGSPSANGTVLAASVTAVACHADASGGATRVRYGSLR